MNTISLAPSLPRPTAPSLIKAFTGLLNRRPLAARQRACQPTVQVSLARDELHRVRQANGFEIRCHEGRLWLTLDNHPADIFVDAGETYRCAKGAKALLQALTPARFELC
jgi:hypothetical protein